MAVSTKMAVFWVVAPFSLVEVYHSTRSRPYSPLVRSRFLPWLTDSYISNRFHSLGLLIALMMEAARTSETLVNFYQTSRRYNPEDSHLLSTILHGTTTQKTAIFIGMMKSRNISWSGHVGNEKYTQNFHRRS
jgi:hypothetical protein